MYLNALSLFSGGDLDANCSTIFLIYTPVQWTICCKYTVIGVVIIADSRVVVDTERLVKMSGETESTTDRPWLEDVKEKWIKIDPLVGKGLLRQYPPSKFTKFGFGGWTSKLEEDDGYDFWVLVMNNTKKQNKKGMS